MPSVDEAVIRGATGCYEMTKSNKRGGKSVRTDVMSEAKRSAVMSSIRGSDTGPELLLRKALWRRGLRYRVKSRLPGKPDLIFPTARVAVFIDGCFWHRCPQHATNPKNNATFWEKKLARNVERDLEVNEMLRDQGWTVIRFWEHEIESDLAACERTVVEALRNESARHNGRAGEPEDAT